MRNFLSTNKVIINDVLYQLTSTLHIISQFFTTFSTTHFCVVFIELVNLFLSFCTYQLCIESSINYHNIIGVSMLWLICISFISWGHSAIIIHGVWEK